MFKPWISYVEPLFSHVGDPCFERTSKKGFLRAHGKPHRCARQETPRRGSQSFATAAGAPAWPLWGLPWGRRATASTVKLGGYPMRSQGRGVARSTGSGSPTLGDHKAGIQTQPRIG